jgi:AcrR family transcriptional regulator
MPQRPAQMCSRRRRNAVATRSAILEAATQRFAIEGFERVGVREIAADAGVTAAMVIRYFVSKEGLFAEVIENTFSGHLVEGDRATLADSLARMMVYGRKDKVNDRRIPLLLLLHSATEPRAAELLKTSLERNMLRVLAESLGGPDADIRAAMMIAQCVGFKILDQMLRPRALTEAQREKLVVLLSASLAVCID